MAERQSDEYADLLATTKLDQLLEAFFGANGEFASMREYAEHVVRSSVGTEFLISKGQVRITFDLRPAAEVTSGPVEL